MEKELQEQLRLKIHNVYATVFQLSGYDTDQLKEKAEVIISFIDQNFIGKEEMREKVDKLKDGNHPLGYFWAMEKVLEQLK